MTPNARRAALRMIANEYALTQRDLLDSFGRPLVLRPVRTGNVEALDRVARSVLDRLPVDLSELFTRPVAGDGNVTLVADDHRVFFALQELRSPSSERWVLAVCGTFDPLDRVDDPAAEDARIVVNELNAGDSGAAWTSTVSIHGTRSLVRLCGAARRLDDAASWCDLLVHLLVSALAAAEAPSLGPASTFAELLAHEQCGKLPGPTGADVLGAAHEFRGSFDRPLSRLVLVSETDDGAVVSVPFHDDDVEVLAVSLSATSDGPAPHRAGLRVVAPFPFVMPRESAYRWASTFNGDDGEPGSSGWALTTPWLLGSWQVVDRGDAPASIVYRGFVPAVLLGHAGIKEILAGVVRESWSAAARWRLRRQFERTVVTSSEGPGS